MKTLSLSEDEASKATNGILLGELPATRESKGSWSELYLYENQLCSVCYSDMVDCWIIFGEVIDKTDLNKYVSDVDNAIKLLKENNFEI